MDLFPSPILLQYFPNYIPVAFYVLQCRLQNILNELYVVVCIVVAIRQKLPVLIMFKGFFAVEHIKLVKLNGDINSVYLNWILSAVY